MAVGSFTSVFLESPLVAFLPSKTSSLWQALAANGDSFCVNVLRTDQEDLWRAIATRTANKFEIEAFVDTGVPELQKRDRVWKDGLRGLDTA